MLRLRGGSAGGADRGEPAVPVCDAAPTPPASSTASSTATPAPTPPRPQQVPARPRPLPTCAEGQHRSAGHCCDAGHAWVPEHSRCMRLDGAPARVTEGCVELAGGTFLMGAPTGEGSDQERPQHRVTVSPFCIDRTEVTVGAYRACRAAGACEEPIAYSMPSDQWRRDCNRGREGIEGHPINCVTLAQAERFCTWRYPQGGDLPTEDQWEFAARGTANRRYPWGNIPDPSPSNCNLTYPDRWPTTAPVGELPVSGDTPEGLIGMAGNVWELTRTRYVSYREDAGSATRRHPYVARGGGWGGTEARSTVRSTALVWSGSTGFRCVRAGR